ncbi:hypothetical protein D3C84_598240 [compost metagenome]
MGHGPSPNPGGRLAFCLHWYPQHWGADEWSVKSLHLPGVTQTLQQGVTRLRLLLIDQ